jgi:phosphoribosylglycinamide formyltransferase-1
MKNIVILISGRGSNMEASCRPAPPKPGTRASRRWSAIGRMRRGLSSLASRGIPTAVVDHMAYPTRDAFDAELARVVDAYAPDVIVLAGFMRILTPDFVQRYAGRLLNVHPSLLPAFPGLHTHRRAIEAGCKVAGATVHVVTPALDHGPIVIQALVPVLPGDTESTLAARVLAREHVIYPRAVRWMVEGVLREETRRRDTCRGRVATSPVTFAGLRTGSPRC